MTPRSWPKALAKSFKTAYPRARWVWVSFLATLSLFPFLVFFGFEGVPKERDPLYYLLGAQAETLGTIFVLAFTLSLVAAQVASRYHRVLFDRILGGWAMWYAAPFGTGIILPLFLLHGYFFIWSTAISLLIAAYCIFSLIPFTLAVRKLLSISEALKEKHNEVLAATDRTEREHLINDLSDIALGALYVNDYNAFQNGVAKLEELADRRTNKKQLTLLVGAEVLELLRRNTEHRFASGILLDAMVKISLYYIPDEKAEITLEMLDHLSDAYAVTDIVTLRSHRETIRSIYQFASAAIVDHRIEEVLRCQNILHTISERAITELPAASETGREAVGMMGEIIQSTLASTIPSVGRDRLLNHAIAQLEAIGTKANAVGQSRVAGSVQVQILRAMRDNTTHGQRIRGRVEASLAVLTSNQPLDLTVPDSPGV